ncbi:MAG: hypothetical protein ACREEW_12550, partial [Caulobacteraceae bacterium]
LRIGWAMAAASTTVAHQREPGPIARASREARLRLLLASGGDDRIWLDPVTRRNRYGAPAAPAPEELWFSSSTASPISPTGWQAAGEALEALGTACGPNIAAWFDSLRARLLALYGARESEVVLAASGTEAELVVLTLALALAERPLVNIVVAPAETGSGVPAAASGRHFLGSASLGATVAQHRRLPGWEEADLTLQTIEIRRADGSWRSQGDVDQEAALKVERAVAGGAFALLHVLDASKTGRPGVSRAAAIEICARYPGRVVAAIDACQLRCGAERLREDLRAGLVAMVSGSKFAGGPAFCGAVLLPAEIADRLARACGVGGAALAPYSALLDWPSVLRPAFARGLAHPANLGLGLRWAAALAEIDAYEAVPATLRAAMLADFDRAVRDRVAADPGLELLDPPSREAAPGLTAVVHVDGRDAGAVYRALGEGAGGERPVRLGQPVAIGARTALRVCASMPMIAEAARSGFSALEDDLDEAFGSWAKLRV